MLCSVKKSGGLSYEKGEKTLEEIRRLGKTPLSVELRMEAGRGSSGSATTNAEAVCNGVRKNIATVTYSGNSSGSSNLVAVVDLTYYFEEKDLKNLTAINNCRSFKVVKWG